MIISNKNYTILCVDDIEENLYTYELILSKIKNIEILKATSGDEALKIVLQHKIDLILLDIQMPGMDGYEFAKYLQQKHDTKSIPIVFITAVYKQEEFIAKGFEIGAVDYLTKPLDDNLLLNRIKLYLNIFSQKNEAIATQNMLYDFVESIGDGLFVLDGNGTIEYINNIALRLLGYQYNEILGQSVFGTMYNEQNGISEKNLILQPFATKSIKKIPKTYLRKKDHKSIPVTIIVSPIIKNESVEKVVCHFRDISNELKYQTAQQQIITSRNEMIFMLVEAIDKRDPYTAGHTQRVALYCQKIANVMGFAQDEIEILINAAHLHDVGKISTPDSILLKPGYYDHDEYQIMKEHLDVGYNLISNIKEYEPIAEIMKYHHERYDGNGYPLGLSGDAIPPIARIMIVADAFDAMTTNRVYKKRKSLEEALREIKNLSGIQFHPEVVDAAMIALQDVQLEAELDQNPKTTIEEKRFAYYYNDRLTGCYDIEYIAIVLDIYFKNIDAYAIKINLKKMNHYNSKYGWESGNKLLGKFGQFLKDTCKEKFIFRFFGDDFIILSKEKIECKQEILQEFLGQFDSELGIEFEYYTLLNELRTHEVILNTLSKKGSSSY